MQFLAEFYKVDNWKDLKKGKKNEILRTFAWANTNSLESWGVTAKQNGANYKIWKKLKISSENYFDSFTPILEIFMPDLVVVMNWMVSKKYWNYDVKWEKIGDHLLYTANNKFGTHIFKTAHPTWLNHNNIRKETIAKIVRKWKIISN